MKKHKIRVYKGTMETRHGVDAEFHIADPVNPPSEEYVIDKLKSYLGYENEKSEDDDEEDEERGSCEGGWAYFDYWGYEDVDIPESIVERILKGE